MTTYTSLPTFRAAAKKAAPTKQHRAAVWECMLGAVYAMNAAGRVQYFDYDYAAAMAFVGAVNDVRCARHRQYKTHVGHDGEQDSYMLPRDGQLVWWVRDNKV